MHIMASRKPRKRAYTPPQNEVSNKRQHAPRSKSARGGGTRNSYQPQPPSWRRTLRRLPIYFIIIFGLQYFVLKSAEDLSKNERLLQALGTAAIVTLAFAPFMHLMDRMSYNRWAKKQGPKSGSTS
jgi:hypothetical protein